MRVGRAYCACVPNNLLLRGFLPFLLTAWLQVLRVFGSSALFLLFGVAGGDT